MVEMEKAQKAFQEYANQYDRTNPRILLKITHMQRVAKVALTIAKSLEIEKEEQKLAELIGLLHDIGRFEQLKQYGSFIDYETVDHADMSCKVLFEEKKIREYISEDNYDSIIQKAIQNHNKFQIEEGLSPKELLHAKIIRDADKIDIFEVNLIEKNEVKAVEFQKQKEGISKKVLDTFKNRQLIYGPDRKTYLDFQISILAFLFDLNFEKSFEIVKEKDYVNRIASNTICQRQEDREILEEVRKIANAYIEEKLKERNKE